MSGSTSFANECDCPCSPKNLSSNLLNFSECAEPFVELETRLWCYGDYYDAMMLGCWTMKDQMVVQVQYSSMILISMF